MKLKIKQQLHELNRAELLKKLQEAEQFVAETRLKVKAGQEKNVKAVGAKRQEIAVIKTILSLKKE